MTVDHCHIGIVGLRLMGKNLVLNLLDHGFRVAVYNRTQAQVDEFLTLDEVRGKPITPCRSLRELVESLEAPRKVLLMIKTGDPVATEDARLYPERSPIDDIVAQLCQLLSPGDVIIDGGNTHFRDTQRRVRYVESLGLFYVGAGISGGEVGARYGASVMPGGSSEAWPLVRRVLQAIAAKAGDDQTPCCDWIGPDGAGHYVKMVHNGIEYGDIQLICEAYWLLKHALGLSNAELHQVFRRWNETELNSYLIEITQDIFTVQDQETGASLVDLVLDEAGAKETGKWMSQSALDLGIPSTLVTAAVQARSLSAMKQARCRANKRLPGVSVRFQGDREAFIDDVHQALLASTICSYAQGFMQLQAAAAEQQWPINLASVATLWRGGCIIRAGLLEPIKAAFEEEPNLENLLLAPHFAQTIDRCQAAWRRVVMLAAELGLPTPAHSSALAYYDGYRSEFLPANLLQAQRDYFGAHTYRRVDKPGQGPFHTPWRWLVTQFRRLCGQIRSWWRQSRFCRAQPS